MPKESSTEEPLLLVIDDDEGVRPIVAEHLHAEGFRVVVARDGRSGVERLRAHRGEVVAALVDYALEGGLDGIATLGALRDLCPDLPAILMSGNLKESLGPLPPLTRFLGKPFRLADLSACVKSLLGQDASRKGGAGG